MNAKPVSIVLLAIFIAFIGLQIVNSFPEQSGQKDNDKAQAQKPPASGPGKARLDSLLGELPKNKEVTDTNGVKLLLSISREYLPFDPSMALKYADRALQVAQLLSFKRGQSQAYLSRGIIYSAINSFDRSVESLEKALVIAEELNIRPDIMKILSNLGVTYARKPDFQKAAGYFESALKIAQELNDKKSMQSHLFYIGKAYLSVPDLQKSMENLEKSLKLARELRDSAEISKSLSMIGSVYINSSNYAKALEYFEKALDISGLTGNIRETAENYSSIGMIYHYTSDFKKSLDYYKKSLDLFRRIGFKHGVGRCLMNMGGAYHRLADYSQSIECYSQSMKIFNEMGDKNSVSMCLGNMGSIYMSQNDYPRSLDSYQSCLAIAEGRGDKSMICKTIGNMGDVYRRMADFPKAMDHYEKALSIAESINDKKLIQVCLGNMGSVYSDLGDYNKAMDYHDKSAKIALEINDKFSYALQLGNMGDICNKQKKYSEALDKFTNALRIYNDIGAKSNSAYALGFIGEAWYNMSDFSKAFEYYEKSFNAATELGDERLASKQSANIGSLLLAMAKDPSVKDTTGRQANLVKASGHLEKAVKSFGQRGELKEKQDYLYKLEEAYAELGIYDKALSAYKEGREIQDSIFSAENQKKIAELDARRELEVKEKENKILQQKTEIQQLDIAKQNQAFQLLSSQRKVQSLDLARKNSELLLLQKDKNIKDLELKKTKAEGAKKARDIAFLTKENQYQSVVRSSLIGAFILASAIALLIFFFFRRKIKDNRKLHDLNEVIKTEQDKSESLLQNILPIPVASRLKEGEKHVSDYFEEASIVFIDIVDFSLFSSNTTPERLIEVLNNVYTEFDNIAGKYGLEKIKTIGDCYMAVSGVPVRNPSHAMAAAQFATEAMSRMNGSDFGDGRNIYFRTGIDSGPVIAGVIGEKKFIYDLWGDAVNTASRMEEFGVTGRIQCTGRFRSAYYSSAIHDGHFSFKERGLIEVKGKGYMNTYFLEKEETHESEPAL